MSDVDVVVLGAGPAGAAAAITCAAMGYRVIVLERDAFRRPAPGETLHPGVQPLLQQLGVEEHVLGAGFLRHPGHVIRWGGPEFFQPFGNDAAGPWLGFQAWRPTFDTILLDRARKLGTTVVQPCQLRGVIVNDDRVAGVTTDSGSIHCRFTVDATGRWRAVSRHANLGWEQQGPTRRVWYRYVSGCRPTRNDVPALIADAEGWTWTARVRADTFQWVRLNFDNRRLPDGWGPPDLSGSTPCSPMRGADATWRIASRPAGSGYFLVGDAASMLDPASSHGVLKALMSGMLAGFLINQVFGGGVSAGAAGDAYCRWMRAWFTHDLARLTDLYAKVTPPRG